MDKKKNITLVEEDDIMATSSFSKNFTLDSKKAVDSFTRMIMSPSKSIKIDRSLTSSEKEKQGELKLRQILSR
ncbi:hypothetical protein ACR77J_08145 [Tissierella praeacuta]|uniref:hypothetical protein n=1 Tax=Tissierella praeacuta TaxID=43131 RepID=UPI003DA54EB5